MLRLALLALLVVTTPLSAATLQTESRIDRVTVYPQGATVTRVADARITYSGQGFVADSNAMGWATRFFTSIIWPF